MTSFDQVNKDNPLVASSTFQDIQKAIAKAGRKMKNRMLIEQLIGDNQEVTIGTNAGTWVPLAQYENQKFHSKDLGSDLYLMSNSVQLIQVATTRATTRIAYYYIYDVINKDLIGYFKKSNDSLFKLMNRQEAIFPSRRSVYTSLAGKVTELDRASWGALSPEDTIKIRKIICE